MLIRKSEAEIRKALVAWGEIRALLRVQLETLPERPVREVVTWIIEHDDPDALEADPLLLRILALVKSGDYESAAATIRGTRAPQ